MIDPISFLFFLGLLSAVHCVGMCGGIMAAFSLGLPPELPWWRRLPWLLSVNLGRVLVYMALGALAGGVGMLVSQSPWFVAGHWLLRGLAALLLLLTGLAWLELLPARLHLDRLGLAWWKRLEPLGRRLRPIGSHPKALLFGMLWGFFPCGLVYTAVGLAALSGGPWGMAAFAAGTLPATLGVGLVTGSRPPGRGVRRLVGVLLIAFALGGFLLPGLVGIPENWCIPGMPHP